MSQAPLSVFVLIAAINEPCLRYRVIAVFDTQEHAQAYADGHHVKDYWRIEQHRVRTP